MTQFAALLPTSEQVLGSEPQKPPRPARLMDRQSENDAVDGVK